MALNLQLLGVKWLKGQYSLHPIAEMGVNWNYIDDPRFRKIKLNGGYLDAFATLSTDEALEIVKPYYEERADLWCDPKQLEKLGGIEVTLREVDFVFAHLIEWESGF